MDYQSIIQQILSAIDGSIRDKSAMHGNGFARLALAKDSWTEKWVDNLSFLLLAVEILGGLLCLNKFKLHDFDSIFAASALYLLAQLVIVLFYLEGRVKKFWCDQVILSVKPYKRSYNFVVRVCLLQVVLSTIGIYLSWWYARSLPDKDWYDRAAYCLIFLGLSTIICFVLVSYTLLRNKFGGRLIFTYDFYDSSKCTYIDPNNEYVNANGGIEIVINNSNSIKINLCEYSMCLIGNSILVIDSAAPIILWPEDYEYISVTTTKTVVKWKYSHGDWQTI